MSIIGKAVDEALRERAVQNCITPFPIPPRMDKEEQAAADKMFRQSIHRLAQKLVAMLDED